jgi:hypothetical protein
MIANDNVCVHPNELLSMVISNMGNTVSASGSASSATGTDEIESMALKLDLYAQRIILKEVKFNSSLSDSGKCEKLIIITSEVLNRLPFRLISYMDRRHKLFSERYEMFNAMDRALLVNTNPEILKENKLDEPNEFRKRQMCVGLARFYVQIGNLFNAIMSTMRPYNYENTRRTGPDNFYDMLTFGLIEGRNAGAEDRARYETSNMSGFSKKQKDMREKLDRILRFGTIVPDIAPGAGICSLKNDLEQSKITPMTMAGTSSSENKIRPSIFAMLEELYYDIFHQTSSTNPKTPQFIAMSAAMKEKIYRTDVQHLYRIVTGGKEPGPDIKTFADVSRYINDNDEINAWCQRDDNKTLKIHVTDELRSDSGFVEYIKHVKEMMRSTTKDRKAIISLLDRIFVTMKKSDEELLQIEENWDKGAYRRIEGFERDDEYSRKFFQLNLKYDFFINPNLTDADLQIITNEARTRIVRLYADSYQRFFKGFQILQKIQEAGALKALMAKVDVAKKAQEQPGSGNGREKTEVASSEKINWEPSTTLYDEKQLIDEIHKNLSSKNGSVADEYRRTAIQIYDKASQSEKTMKNNLWNNVLTPLNNFMKPYTENNSLEVSDVQGRVIDKIRQYQSLLNQMTQPAQLQRFDSLPVQRTVSGGIIGTGQSYSL